MTDNTVKCPFCLAETEYGSQVCTGSNGQHGCQATIVYGATPTELYNTFKQTGFSIFAVVMLILFMGPTLLNSQFDWSLAPMFGTGIWSMAIGVVLGVWLGLRSRNALENSMRGQVRFFRHMANV